MIDDPLEFRSVLGRFATGVTVVTGLTAAGQPLGVTVNAFSALSLEPPLVLFCLATLECTGLAVHEGGDHVIIVGRVGRMAAEGGGDPLLFFKGAYARFGGHRAD